MDIYLDMDDVVADWMGYARAYLKQPQWKEGEMLPDKANSRSFSKKNMPGKGSLSNVSLEQTIHTLET